MVFLLPYDNITSSCIKTSPTLTPY